MSNAPNEKRLPGHSRRLKLRRSTVDLKASVVAWDIDPGVRRATGAVSAAELSELLKEHRELLDYVDAAELRAKTVGQTRRELPRVESPHGPLLVRRDSDTAVESLRALVDRAALDGAPKSPLAEPIIDDEPTNVDAVRPTHDAASALGGIDESAERPKESSNPFLSDAESAEFDDTPTDEFDVPGKRANLAELDPVRRLTNVERERTGASLRRSNIPVPVDSPPTEYTFRQIEPTIRWLGDQKRAFRRIAERLKRAGRGEKQHPFILVPKAWYQDAKALGILGLVCAMLLVLVLA